MILGPRRFSFGVHSVECCGLSSPSLYGKPQEKRVTLPTYRLTLATIMLVLVSISTITPSVVATSDSSYGPLTTPIASGLKAALEWLATNESSDGSYGAYFDHWTAAGAYALWLNDTQSTRATKSYSWLATQIDNPAYWYWGAYGEAMFLERCCSALLSAIIYA